MDIASGDLERGLAALGLSAARTMPMAWWVPALGGASVPAPVRVALGLALSALCLPKVAAGLPAGGAPLWLLLGARELAVGFTLAFVASCVFRAAEAAGRLIDILRGANLAEVLVPGAEERTSATGGLYLLLATVVFLELGGLPRLVAALGSSYDAVPLGFLASKATLAAVVAQAGRASAGLIASAVGFAAPVLVAVLLTDAALGFLGRITPQVPLYFVGMPVKALLGVGITLMGLGATRAAMAGELAELGRALGGMIKVWR